MFSVALPNEEEQNSWPLPLFVNFGGDDDDDDSKERSISSDCRWSSMLLPEKSSKPPSG